MIIDSHAHLELDEITGEDYIRLMNASGVNKVVLLASFNSVVPPIQDWQVSILRFMLFSPLQSLAQRTYESLIKGDYLKGGGKTIKIIQNPDNDVVSQVVSKYPERFMAFVSINPKLKNALEILEKGIEEQGMVGVKCHPWWHQIDLSSEMLPIARRCEEKGLPLLLHLGGSPKTGNFEVLLNKFPRLKLILAHLAVPYFQSWRVVKEAKNCFIDISGSYVNASLVRRAVKTMGPDKVIFGSDGPVPLRCRGGGHSYEAVLRWTRELLISDNDKEKIFHKNLERLLP